MVYSNKNVWQQFSKILIQNYVSFTTQAIKNFCKIIMLRETVCTRFNRAS
jgi:hypothetical protein